MRLLLSFDTEDFTDALSNDALLRIARLLADKGVRATFGLVGEKVRFLRDGGREDIVEALREHEVAYHSDNHFLFPNPLYQPVFTAEYVEQRTWDESVDRLLAVEARGLRDIEDLFGMRPTTMLRTSGDSAAPLIFAYHLLGLRAYGYGLTAGASQMAPVFWFANMLCSNLPVIFEGVIYRREWPETLDEHAARSADAVNVRFHPCMFIASKWWDLVNFEGTRDVNRFGPFVHAPRLEPAEAESRLARLGEFVDDARARGCEFITYAEHAQAFRDPPGWIDRAAVVQMAQALRCRLAWCEVGGVCYSLAEMAGAIAWAILNPDAARVPLRRVIGPVCRPAASPVPEPFDATATDLYRAFEATEHEMGAFRRVPSEAVVGGRTVTPASLFRAAARRLLDPDASVVTPEPLHPEGFERSFDEWDRVRGSLITFHPEKRTYRSPRMIDVVKLQYWSYKPG